jgi:hypothetical protein
MRYFPRRKEPDPALGYGAVRVQTGMIASWCAPPMQASIPFQPSRVTIHPTAGHPTMMAGRSDEQAVRVRRSARLGGLLAPSATPHHTLHAPAAPGRPYAAIMRHDCGERTAHRLVPIVHIDRIASYHAGRHAASWLSPYMMRMDEELMAVIMPAFTRQFSPILLASPVLALSTLLAHGGAWALHCPSLSVKPS